MIQEKTGRKNKPGAGRPLMARLDLEEMGRLIMCSNASNRELALIFGVDDKTIANNYSAFIAKKRAERRLGLKSEQTKRALRGDTTLLIWLGKNELEQTDKQAVAHSGEVSTVLRFDYGNGNGDGK
jgi:hypothetical protein